MISSVVRRRVLAAVSVGILATVSACSSSGKSGTSGTSSGTSGTSSGTSGTSGGGSSGVEAAKNYIQPFLTTPTKITVTTPLTSKPPAGKTVFLVSDNAPSAVEVINGFKEGTAALGWTLKILYYAQLTDGNGLIQQALSQGADYIAYIALPSALIGPGIAAAKAKGVPLFQTYDLTAAQGEKNWIFSQIDSTNAWLTKGKINADWVIANSNGKANTLAVNVPSFAVLKLWEDSFKAEFAKNCPSCVTSLLDVPFGDVSSGKVPSEVVSYLRAHPKVNNIVFPTGGFDTGVVEAAKTAGITIGGSGIQLSVQAPEKGDRTDIVNGVEAMALGGPNGYNGWLAVDAMARYSLKMDLTENWASDSKDPLLIQTKQNLKNADDDYQGPTGYQDQFKALWKVG